MTTTFDEITQIGNSIIHHGVYNQRIYLLKLDDRDLPQITEALNALAMERGYTKIFAKIPMEKKLPFLVNGYRQEAMVPNFYRGQADAAFLGKYYCADRQTCRNMSRINEIIALARAKAGKGLNRAGDLLQQTVRQLNETDAVAMSTVYKQVFKTYPFPIHDPDYIRDTMQSHIRYYGVLDHSRIVALASSEFDFESQNVEMTDFATLPTFLGNGFAAVLLAHMEKELAHTDIKTAYTIARAESPGMNITFSKLGYVFGGTLINNTNISGGIESMNIWYKTII